MRDTIDGALLARMLIHAAAANPTARSSTSMNSTSSRCPMETPAPI